MKKLMTLIVLALSLTAVAGVALDPIWPACAPTCPDNR